MAYHFMLTYIIHMSNYNHIENIKQQCNTDIILSPQYRVPSFHLLFCLRLVKVYNRSFVSISFGGILFFSIFILWLPRRDYLLCPLSFYQLIWIPNKWRFPLGMEAKNEHKYQINELKPSNDIRHYCNLNNYTQDQVLKVRVAPLRMSYWSSVYITEHIIFSSLTDTCAVLVHLHPLHFLYLGQLWVEQLFLAVLDLGGTPTGYE